MKKTLSILLAALALATASDGFSATKKVPTRTLSGTLFNDAGSFNGRLDKNEKGLSPGTVYLYQILPNGARRLVRKVETDRVGNYKIPSVRFGRYFLAIRFKNTKFSVRTGSFLVGSKTSGNVRNIPQVSRTTVRRYGNTYTPVANPAQLNRAATISPSSP